MTDPVSEQEQPRPKRVTAVVVSYERAGLLRRCLEALERQEERETIEVLVVENGSRDESAAVLEDFPQVRPIPLPRNLGLTKAMNLGWRAAEAEYVLFLHEDTELPPQAVREMAAALDARADATAVCPLLVDAEGRPAPQLGNWPPDDRWAPAAEAEEPYSVDYPRGAVFMIRKFFIQAMRHLDERYGQFGADADISFQIRRAARKFLLLPQVRALHHGRAWDDALRQADARAGAAVFTGKYRGFLAGLAARAGAGLGCLLTLRLKTLYYLLALQKIDGSQV